MEIQRDLWKFKIDVSPDSEFTTEMSNDEYAVLSHYHLTADKSECHFFLRIFST